MSHLFDWSFDEAINIEIVHPVGMEIVDLSDHLRIPVNHQSEDTLIRSEISITESVTQKIVIER